MSEKFKFMNDVGAIARACEAIAYRANQIVGRLIENQKADVSSDLAYINKRISTLSPARKLDESTLERIEQKFLIDGKSYDMEIVKSGIGGEVLEAKILIDDHWKDATWIFTTGLFQV